LALAAVNGRRGGICSRSCCRGRCGCRGRRITVDRRGGSDHVVVIVIATAVADAVVLLL